MAEVERLVAGAALVTSGRLRGLRQDPVGFHVGAELLDDFADGVWLADLAAVADPGAVRHPGRLRSSLSKRAPGMTAD